MKRDGVDWKQAKALVISIPSMHLPPDYIQLPPEKPQGQLWIALCLESVKWSCNATLHNITFGRQIDYWSNYR